MTKKQIFNLIGIILSIISAIGLLLPTLLYDGNTKLTYLNLTFTRDGFKGVLFIGMVSVITNIAFGLLSLSHDRNKYFHLVSLVSGIISGIILINAQKLSDDFLELWLTHTKLAYGAYIIIISSFLSSISYLVIALRIFVFKIDDYATTLDEVLEESVLETNETNSKTESDAKDWFDILGEEKPKDIPANNDHDKTEF